VDVQKGRNRRKRVKMSKKREEKTSHRELEIGGVKFAFQFEDGA
jgi:hypothetical protein